MTIIATLGPKGSNSSKAASYYNSQAELQLFPNAAAALAEFTNKKATHLLVPIYNTREGLIIDNLNIIENSGGYWIDNWMLPINLSIGAINPINAEADINFIVSTGSVFKQCSGFLKNHFPNASFLTVTDIDLYLKKIKRDNLLDYAVIESEDLLRHYDLAISGRDLVPYNRTRYAIISNALSEPSGYDSTIIISRPLRDRVGMLANILQEFNNRGINLLDLHTENDIKTQKLQIYIETEGHINHDLLKNAINHIETKIIQEKESIKILGSFPRLDLREKKIKSIGFIGTGDMSIWFADRLKSEGYEVLLSGRSSELRPEDMIAKVDMVIVCVPISFTKSTVETYAPLLNDNQALIIMAGESEECVDAAISKSSDGVEVMLVHNLWGPQAANMNDKNAILVKTVRSASLCTEFEAFLYKHGAEIYHDSADKHDLLMGVSQKLPTTISVALAMALRQNNISSNDIDSHSTLTSLYGILAMARMHNQHSRTYAEIMSTTGDGKKIVKSFAKNLLAIIDLADNGKIDDLCEIIEENQRYLPQTFLNSKMDQAKAIDEILSNSAFKI